MVGLLHPENLRHVAEDVHAHITAMSSCCDTMHDLRITGVVIEHGVRHAANAGGLDGEDVPHHSSAHSESEASMGSPMSQHGKHKDASGTCSLTPLCSWHCLALDSQLAVSLYALPVAWHHCQPYRRSSSAAALLALYFQLHAC